MLRRIDKKQQVGMGFRLIRWHSNIEIGGLRLAIALSFSHVGHEFQIITQKACSPQRVFFVSAWAPDVRFLRYRYQHVGIEDPTQKSPNAKFLADPTRVISLYSTGFFTCWGPKLALLSRVGGNAR